MTKEEAISNLKAFLDGDTSIGNIIPLRSVLESAIKYLEPSLPSNLDEAAEKATGEYVYNDGGPFPGTTGVSFKNGFKSGAEWMQNRKFLEVLENEPLDSAARKMFEDWIPTEVLTIGGGNGGIPLYNQGALIMMFKAGAVWMAGQGWSRELEVKEDAGGYPYIDKHIELYDYDTDEPLAKKGDKVVVQIRKK